MTGNFQVLHFESQEEFDGLRNALRTEHQPRTATESLLVDRIAEHVWLSQRSQRFADLAFLDHDEKMMALMLRYRTTHDRAFHKCLAELRTVRKERREQQFDSKTEKPGRSCQRSEGERQEFESQKEKPRWSKQEALEKARQYADANFERIEREIQADLVRIAREAEAAANSEG